MTLAELLALLLGSDAPDLSGLTDEDLATAEQTLIEAFAERRPTARGEEALAELSQIADAADIIRAEAGARLDAAEAEQAAIAELEARLTPVVEDEATDEPVAEQPEAEQEAPAAAEAEAPAETQPVAEPVAAAATTTPARTRPRPAPLGSLRSDSPPAPQQHSAANTTVRVLATGAENPGRLAIAEAFIDMDRHLGRAMPGAQIMQPVINVQGVPDPARRLVFGNQAHNDSIVYGRFGREALMAAGGFCGPSTPYYNLAMISNASRPLHDSLNALSVAGRGSITFNSPLALSDFSGAITAWTKDNDTGDDPSPSSKNCVTIDCSSPNTEEVQAFARCLTISNFMDRYSPEMVAQAIDLTMVQWAMASETYLLDRIKNASTAVTVDSVLGTAADVVYTVGLAAENFRNSDRMLSDVGLVAMFPHWIISAFAGDLARASHQYAEQLRVTREQFVADLANLNVRPIFYIDTPSTGPSQKFAAQGAGALNQYPTQMQWGLAHDGAHVPLDGGPELNFGVVRDSTGNQANTYQSFGESFEGYAFLGVKAWWLTQNLCPAGAFSAPTDLFSEICGAS